MTDHGVGRTDGGRTIVDGGDAAQVAGLQRDGEAWTTALLEAGSTLEEAEHLVATIAPALTDRVRNQLPGIDTVALTPWWSQLITTATEYFPALLRRYEPSIGPEARMVLLPCRVLEGVAGGLCGTDAAEVPPEPIGELCERRPRAAEFGTSIMTPYAAVAELPTLVADRGVGAPIFEGPSTTVGPTGADRSGEDEAGHAWRRWSGWCALAVVVGLLDHDGVLDPARRATSEPWRRAANVRAAVAYRIGLALTTHLALDLIAPYDGYP